MKIGSNIKTNVVGGEPTLYITPNLPMNTPFKRGVFTIFRYAFTIYYKDGTYSNYAVDGYTHYIILKGDGTMWFDNNMVTNVDYLITTSNTGVNEVFRGCY